MDSFLLKFTINAMTDYDLVTFPFLDDGVPRSDSYGVYITQRIRFEPPHGNTNNLHRRKQRRRSASR